MNTKIQNIFSGKRQKPIIIAGPCSAETEQQVLSTARGIAEIGSVDIFRAGIWKPRTRPGSFEGIGIAALPWLSEVKKQTNLLTAVEAATTEHIEICLKHAESVDIIWIGARTTANPFSVQALADALQGVDIPVFIKNPLNPDMSLWIGAVERFQKAGIVNIGIIHRGFYPFVKSAFRNIPKWDLPLDMKCRFPNIPLICDPSHIAGKTEYLAEISQKAMNLNFDGLMIETHINPSQALSDAEQQVTPIELKELIEKIVIRQTSSENPEIRSLLEKYREQIDLIDFQLLELLAKRMNIAEAIGKYKTENNITVFQLRRWLNIITTRVEFGKKINLNEKFVKKLLQLVHREAIHLQNKNQNGENSL
jgi:chorismate mutase